MNPGEGLKIRPFKGAATPEGLSDHELDYLGQYVGYGAFAQADFSLRRLHNLTTLLR
jgi:hypothetical protein